MLTNSEILDLPCTVAVGAAAVLNPDTRAERAAEVTERVRSIESCFHCGTLCLGANHCEGDKWFCCQGCLTVYQLLRENGLTDFYHLGEMARVRAPGIQPSSQFEFVDQPAIRQQLVDFSNDRLTRVTFHVPAIHCIACVWLLENLFRLQPGLGHCQVHFPKKQVAIAFETRTIQLSQVITLLSSLGYAPELKYSNLGTRPTSRNERRLWLQLGIAGFAFGNTMLFSVASYFGLDSVTGPGLTPLVGWISLLLAIPVVVYSAADYWKSAWISLRQGWLNLDVPIVAGILALFVQSTWEVLTARGNGYFDSLAGLLFFLLCGKVFQRKSFDRLSFDRDYRSFFPLSVARRQGEAEVRISLSQVNVGDRLIVRNLELIPADSRLIAGSACVDYSFVTGESERVKPALGAHLYAGGRQVGATIELEIVKPVSQGYLTTLWNQEAFRKPDKNASLDTLTNRYSQRFTKIVLGIALGAVLFWAWQNPALCLPAFISVLIVACPCALALAAPFSLGAAQRLLARRDVFLKNSSVVERLARADTVIFDKTGTLTTRDGSLLFHGLPLTELENHWVWSTALHSTHPASNQLVQALRQSQNPLPVDAFAEIPGCGVEATVAGHQIQIGSKQWIQQGERNPLPPSQTPTPPSNGEGSIHIAIDGHRRGSFELNNCTRNGIDRLIANLTGEYQLGLLSGDTERERARFAQLFGAETPWLRFNQSPLDKLEFIQTLQGEQRKVVMVGDGLNDAGALQQSDVGVAVVENMSAFSPASDVIIAARMAPHLASVLKFAKRSVRVVQVSFVVSALYNVIGISIAASGHLSPIVCAVLMPLSSVSVILFGCGLTTWYGRTLLPRPL